MDDHYSDRIRCDHPETSDGEPLGEALLDLADDRDRGAVMVIAPNSLGVGIERAGVPTVARIPGLYRGRRDGIIAYRTLAPGRARLANPEAVRRTDRVVHRRARLSAGGTRGAVRTERARRQDAAGIAALIAETFEDYPTPSGVPEYIERQLEQGIPFRVIRHKGRIVSCASADLVREARTAELTDCASHPSQRGRGHMQALLRGLMRDLSAMGYPTVFSLARARVVGMNLALSRLGFVWRGRTAQSCRLGKGLEDINVWSCRLK